MAVSIEYIPAQRTSRNYVGERLSRRTLCIRFFRERILPYPSFLSLHCTLALLISTSGAHAQTLPSTAGALLTLSANGEVKHANDQAHLTLRLDEQDKDRSVAVSRLNQKMKQGIALVKRDDAVAVLTTRGYATTPIYPDEPQKPTAKLRQIVGWRVSQSLDVVTTNLTALPAMVADAQALYALQGLSFALSEPAARQLDAQRIDVAWRNLVARIAAVAHSMGRNSADATIEAVDVDTPANYSMQQKSAMPMAMMRNSAEAVSIEAPDFEAGETALSLQVSAKVRFK